MSDNSFQDVVSGSGRSIRRIPVSRKPKPKRYSNGTSQIGKSSVFGGGRNLSSGRGKSRLGIWLIAIVSIIVLFLIISAFSSGVKVKITPRQEEVVLDGNFTAFKESQSGELKFNLMTVTRELSGEVKATGEEFVEEKASGVIVVYNDYSTATQKLIKNTRFETAGGLIYRIKDAVVVPGKKTVAGKSVPGSLEITVYADEPGETYNIGLSDFTIPGLKGDPRYNKFYARSKTAMIGGVRGNVKKASAEDLANLSASLDEKLRVEILEEATSVKPEGFLLLDGAYIIKSDTRTSNGDGESVVVEQTATLTGIIFDENELAKFVAENTLASYDDLPVKLKNYDDLNFSSENKSVEILENSESINFRLRGTTQVVWDFDRELLIEDLRGQSKKRVDSILSKYPAIKTAEVVIRPFWKRSITDNKDKIKIEVVSK